MHVVKTEKTTLRKVAMITGVAMIMMALLAMFSVGIVSSRLIVDGDAIGTANNIKKSIFLFQAGIFSWLLILILDVLLSWSLYVFFEPIHRSLSLLAAWFRLMYTAFLGVAIFQLVQITTLINESESFQLEDLSSSIMLSVMSYEKIWSFGLIIFAIHLLLIGWMMIKANFIPKILAILMLIASVSYMLIHTMDVFLPQLEKVTGNIESILSLPMAIGELGLGIWMFIKGGKR
ncbi:DUF4386 domain-containing protein [Robertmurraya massiliosenegalensis]|uniref:DUF4386 domain-containing protein n=1 Tax=Robertmurraya TaxID=2837507 RepID=UPI0039A50CC8